MMKIEKAIITLEQKEKFPGSIIHVFKSNLLFPQLVVSTRLNSISGIVITVVENRQNIIRSFWYKEILLALDILVLSILLYFVSKNFQQILFFAWSH